MERDFANHMEHAEEFETPRTGQTIWPFQYCPEYRARKPLIGPALPDCFYCRYGDFPTDRTENFETGFCRYPEIQHY